MVEKVLDQVRDWSLPELEDLRTRVGVLIDGKRLAEDAPRQMDWLIEEFQSAVGRRDGEPWEPPADPLCSYPLGSTAIRGGTLYRSQQRMNMTEPGIDADAWSAVQDGETA